jgi:hypothetical protein
LQQKTKSEVKRYQVKVLLEESSFGGDFLGAFEDMLF